MKIPVLESAQILLPRVSVRHKLIKSHISAFSRKFAANRDLAL